MSISINIFKNDAFSAISLTNFINEQPFVPGQIGRMGLHTEQGVSTTMVGIENYNGTLTLVPNTPRGKTNAMRRDTRKKRYFDLNHFPVEDVINVSELQNMVPLPGQGELESAQGLMQRRMKRQIASLDATVEYGMIGSIKGVIYDADGSTIIYDLFAEFGITQATEDYVLGTDTEILIKHSNAVKNKIEDALGDAPYTSIVAVCGKTWFDKFITHKSVRDAYQYFEAKNSHNPNREDLRYVGFEHGGITYVQYRGKVNGIAYVPDNEAYAFPVGVPELFLQFYGPANYMEYANTEGLPRYAKVGVDPSGYDKFVPWEMQTNPLSICTRPGTLVKLTTSN